MPFPKRRSSVFRSSLSLIPTAIPTEIDAVIPGNDDAIRAVKLIAETMAAAVIEGRQGAEMGTAADDGEAEQTEESAE